MATPQERVLLKIERHQRDIVNEFKTLNSNLFAMRIALEKIAQKP